MIIGNNGDQWLDNEQTVVGQVMPSSHHTLHTKGGKYTPVSVYNSV